MRLGKVFFNKPTELSKKMGLLMITCTPITIEGLERREASWPMVLDFRRCWLLLPQITRSAREKKRLMLP
jgi:hypothetical protein